MWKIFALKMRSFHRSYFLEVLCILLYFCAKTNGSKILLICPVPARSHYNLCKSATDILAGRGHEMTFITAYSSEEPKFKEIVVDMRPFKEKFQMSLDMSNMTLKLWLEKTSTWNSLMASLVFENSGIQNLLNDANEKFDLVIWEYYLNEVFMGFSVRFDCPMIILSPITYFTWTAQHTKNPLNPSTIPNLMSPFTAKMDFWERAINLKYYLIDKIIETVAFDRANTHLYQQYFPKESQIVPYDKLADRISGSLINSHPSVGFPRPMLQNAVEIAGYHINEPEPLPKDLQQIMDEAKHGIVFFSMGSNVLSKDLSLEVRNAILETFGDLKQTVLWKFEAELENTPKNVIIRKWMPQTGILAHPNLKLFITHGGMLSYTEATHYGVPLVVIPIFGDQPHDASLIVEKGQGLKVNYGNITKTSFKWAVTEVINDPKYKQVAKKYQDLFHDRPMKPKDLLIYFVEYIIRTGGAPHLQPQRLSMISHLLLDIIALIFILIVILSIALFYICRMCYRSLKTKRNRNKQKIN